MAILPQGIEGVIMKNSKLIVRIVCLVLASVMVLSLVGSLAFSVFATEGTDLQAQLAALRQESAEYKKKIAANKDNLAKQSETKEYYQKEANNLAAQIELLKQDIAAQEVALQVKQEELALKVTEVHETSLKAKERIAAMYMSHNESALSTLLSVSSFREAMRYSKNMQSISRNDVNVLEDLNRQKLELEAQAAEVQVLIDGLNANKATMDATAAEYATAIQNANNAISATEAELQANTAANEEKQKKIVETEAAWQAWISESAPGADFEYNGAGFSWPLPGYYGYSSDYGVRRVIYGRTDVHRGLDLPAPAGTTIYAAADGIVSTRADWSYGTAVKISHGSGIVTVYGHMSQRFVSDGQAVTAGTPIGAVGSTGNSTGNHLHFEVNVNGTPTNSRPYLGAEISGKLYSKY